MSIAMTPKQVTSLPHHVVKKEERMPWPRDYFKSNLTFGNPLQPNAEPGRVSKQNSHKTGDSE